VQQTLSKRPFGSQGIRIVIKPRNIRCCGGKLPEGVFVLIAEDALSQTIGHWVMYRCEVIRLRLRAMNIYRVPIAITREKQTCFFTTSPQWLRLLGTFVVGAKNAKMRAKQSADHPGGAPPHCQKACRPFLGYHTGTGHRGMLHRRGRPPDNIEETVPGKLLRDCGKSLEGRMDQSAHLVQRSPRRSRAELFPPCKDHTIGIGQLGASSSKGPKSVYMILKAQDAPVRALEEYSRFLNFP